MNLLNWLINLFNWLNISQIWLMNCDNWLTERKIESQHG